MYNYVCFLSQFNGGEQGSTGVIVGVSAGRDGNPVKSPKKNKCELRLRIGSLSSCHVPHGGLTLVAMPNVANMGLASLRIRYKEVRLRRVNPKESLPSGGLRVKKGRISPVEGALGCIRTRVQFPAPPFMTFVTLLIEDVLNESRHYKVSTN